MALHAPAVVTPASCAARNIGRAVNGDQRGQDLLGGDQPERRGDEDVGGSSSAAAIGCAVTRSPSAVRNLVLGGVQGYGEAIDVPVDLLGEQVGGGKDVTRQGQTGVGDAVYDEQRNSACREW